MLTGGILSIGRAEGGSFPRLINDCRDGAFRSTFGGVSLPRGAWLVNGEEAEGSSVFDFRIATGLGDTGGGEEGVDEGEFGCHRSSTDALLLPLPGRDFSTGGEGVLASICELA